MSNFEYLGSIDPALHESSIGIPQLENGPSGDTFPSLIEIGDFASWTLSSAKVMKDYTFLIINISLLTC